MAIPFVSRLGQEEATSATITNAIEDGETHHAVNWVCSFQQGLVYGQHRTDRQHYMLVEHVLNQSIINQSINQPINQSINQDLYSASSRPLLKGALDPEK